MLGSADDLPKEPDIRTMFVEDMSDKQLAEAVRI
jgi:hypothetical protein